MNSDVKRTLRNPKMWIVFVLIALFVWITIFYWIAQPTRAEKLEIWLSADFQLKKEVTDSIAQNVKPYGIKKCVVGSYNPDDVYFAQAFGLKSHSVDVYIMTKDLAETLFQTGLFRDLNRSFDNAEYLVFDNHTCGVRFVGDYYIFINSASQKSEEILQTTVQTLLTGAKV